VPNNTKTIMVDSSVWINYFNKKNTTPETMLLQQLIIKRERIFICPLVYQEVLQGIRDEFVFQKIKSILLFREFTNIDLMTATEKAIEIYRTLRKKGITIRKSADCLIAAYALIGDMYLLHSDHDYIEIAGNYPLRIIS
jgi:predicted nucleic acid-binding protein